MTHFESILPLFRIDPPYAQRVLVSTGQSAVRQVALRPGTILALKVRCPVEDFLVLPAVVSELRKRFPAAAFVLWADECTSDIALLYGRATALEVRALLCGAEPIAPVLRRALTHPISLGDSVANWLKMSGVRLSPRTEYLVREIVEHASRHREVSSLLSGSGETAAAVRARLKKRSLPPARSWFALGQALRAALALQERHESPLLEVALDEGYSDAAVLSRQIHRVFGVRPSELRNALGWEWLMDRWVRLAIKRSNVLHV